MKIYAILILILLAACAAETEVPEYQEDIIVDEPEPESEPVVIQEPKQNEVIILPNSFDQEEITISAGDSVTFINKDAENKHKLYQKGGGLNSPLLFPDEKFDYVFEEPGEFEIQDYGKHFKLMIIVE